MPYTINSSINTKSNPAAPSRRTTRPTCRLEASTGGSTTGSLSLAFNSRPMPQLGITARYRVYDFSNKTERIEFPGYVRFDAVWEAIPRVSVPYSYKRTIADATVSYDFGPTTVEGGYRYLQFDREFRETTRTREHTVIGAVNPRALQWMTLRASYERGYRNHDAYDSRCAARTRPSASPLRIRRTCPRFAVTTRRHAPSTASSRSSS